MFQQTYLTFLHDLARNNQREWFQDNKKTYEKAVRKPFQAFVESLLNAIQEIDSNILIIPKDAINREVRFSKDKTPISAVIGKQGF